MDKDIEQRVCLKFCSANEISCAESLKMLEKFLTYDETALSKTNIRVVESIQRKLGSGWRLVSNPIDLQRFDWRKYRQSVGNDNGKSSFQLNRDNSKSGVSRICSYHLWKNNSWILHHYNAAVPYIDTYKIRTQIFDQKFNESHQPSTVFVKYYSVWLSTVPQITTSWKTF